MKKSLSLILILCMMLSFAPAALAAEDEQVCSQVKEFLPDEEVAEYLDGYNGEKQLEFYAASMMEYGYIPDMSTGTMAWGSGALSEEPQQVLYYTLKEQFKNIAEGDGSGSYINTKLVKEVLEEGKTDESTEATVTVAESPVTFTFEELGIDEAAVPSKSDMMTKAYEKLGFETVVNLLLYDLPYEMYWYDKTEPTYNQAVGSVDMDKKTVTIDSIRVVMPVSDSYKDSAAEPGESDIVVNKEKVKYYSIDTTKMDAAKKAVENARKIIDDNKAKDDYNKLVAFKDKICELAEYNKTAVKNDAYGDPWQMIYVFDGDESTKVVCEGYAKAFQYLCDNGGLLEAVCYTVTGTLSKADGEAENHMWNIVRIGGNSYLVDVTNSDEGTAGDGGGLFLVGTESGSVAEGYSITLSDAITLKYVYDGETQKLDNNVLDLCASSYEYTGEGSGHKESSVWDKDATYHWKVCEMSGHGEEKLNKAEHSYGDFLASTTNKEEEHVATCSVCGVSYTGSHIWQEDTSLRVEPTVNEKGSASYKCTKCGYTNEEEIPALSESHEHDWDSWGGDDSYHWKECKAEGCYVSDNSDKNSYGEHQWDEGTITKEATEKEAGVKTFTCSVCGKTKTEQIPVISKHNWGNTYSHDSKTHWLECADKSCTVTENKNKSGYGEHSYGAYRVISAATATTSGLMQHECLVCGYSETVVIPASGVTDANHTHSWSSWQFTSPNYWERTCSTCGNREINVVSSTTTNTGSTDSKYTMISGANQTWLRGNGTALTFRADIPFSEFEMVKLNGVELPSSYYTASEGSTIITLNDSCTKELSTGVHTIAIYSKYGDKVETNFMVQNATTTSSTTSSGSYAWASPKTGDSADMGLWVTVMAISLMGMTAAAAVIIRKGKRE